MHWMLMPLRRYADFSGRSRRKEYWMFALFLAIVYTVLIGLLATGGLGGDPLSDGFDLLGGTSLIILLLVALVLFIPSLAVTVRRFHDQNRSGWFVLLNFVPYVGGIILLVMMCLEGTKGPNRFGPDPKGPDHRDVFA